MYKLELKTERLYLRPLNSGDLEIIWKYVTDPDISKDMSWDPHKSKSETIEFLKRIENDLKAKRGITWAIFLEKRFCGIFSIISILRKHRSLTYNKGELAYWCVPEYQGKGIMAEAGNQVIDFAFNELNLHKLIVAHHKNNSASENLIRRLNFKVTWEEKEAFMKAGKWIDVKHYELTSENYYKNKNK